MNHYATLNEHGLHPSRMLTELCVANDSGQPKFPALPEAYNYEPVFADLHYDVEYLDKITMKVSDRRGLINPNNGNYIGTVAHEGINNEQQPPPNKPRNFLLFMLCFI